MNKSLLILYAKVLKFYVISKFLFILKTIPVIYYQTNKLTDTEKEEILNYNLMVYIFDDNDKIKLTDTHLASVVADLQEYKLLGSDLQIIDDAFEYLIPDVAKGKKGQYFTPRHVIDMCVKMLNPKKNVHELPIIQSFLQLAKSLAKTIVENIFIKKLMEKDFCSTIWMR